MTTDDQDEMTGPEPVEINGVFTGVRLEANGKKVSHTTFDDKIGCMTKDEIAAILGDRNRVPARVEFGPDWILNQGRRSSCAGYAQGGIMEKTYCRQYGTRHKLGPEFIYAKANGGRDQGALLRKVVEASFDGCGIREMVPYESYRMQEMGPEAQMSAKRFRLARGEVLGIHSDDELATALALNWIVLLAVQVEDPWFKLDGDGVVMPTDGPGNHAIHVDDVRINSKGEYEFDHAGSWGLNYGDKGRGWISWRRHLRNTVKYHEFVACRVMLPDPDTVKLPG